MTRLQEAFEKRGISLRPSTWRRLVDMQSWSDPGIAYLRKDHQDREKSQIEIGQSGLGARYHLDTDSRPSHDILAIYPSFARIDSFLKERQKGKDEDRLHQAFLQTEIGQHFQKIADGLTDNPSLKNRTESLFRAVLELRQLRQTRNETGLQVPDASLIQAWALQLIGRDNPQEFAKLAELAFAEWVTRLSEKPIPHIAQANEWIATKIADHLMQQGQTQGISAVDLGAGTGATMIALAQKLTDKGIAFDSIKGVDITPALVDKAKQLFNTYEHADKLSIEVNNATLWLQKQTDASLDVVTMVYAIHHLPYDQQKKLEELIYRKLKPGGILAIADPTGRSKFNLEYLDVVEPEATAACFRPYLSEVASELQGIGFTIDYKQPQKEVTKTIDETTVVSTQQGDTLDQGTLGYAVVALKPQKNLKIRQN